MFNYRCRYYSKDYHTHLGMHKLPKGISRSHSPKSQEGVSLATLTKYFNPQWPKYFGLKQWIREELGYKQGTLHFLPRLSSLRGVFSLNVDTPNFKGIHPCVLPSLWKIGHTYPIYLIKNNFKSRIIFWCRFLILLN